MMDVELSVQHPPGIKDHSSPDLTNGTSDSSLIPLWQLRTSVLSLTTESTRPNHSSQDIETSSIPYEYSFIRQIFYTPQS